MPNNKGRRRRFGSIRKTPQGEFQASYLGPDGKRHFAPHRFRTQRDADRWLSKAEALVVAGDWTDPERAKVKVKLAEYAEQWVSQRPALRPRTVELYRWLLHKYVVAEIGAVPLGNLTSGPSASGVPTSSTAASRRRWPGRRTGCSARC